MDTFNAGLRAKARLGRKVPIGALDGEVEACSENYKRFVSDEQVSKRLETIEKIELWRLIHIAPVLAALWLKRTRPSLGLNESRLAEEGELFCDLSHLLMIWSEPQKPKHLGTKNIRIGSNYYKVISDSYDNLIPTFRKMRSDKAFSPELRLKALSVQGAFRELRGELRRLVDLSETQTRREAAVIARIRKRINKGELRETINQTIKWAKGRGLALAPYAQNWESRNRPSKRKSIRAFR
jgi:hypothetical protein